MNYNTERRRFERVKVNLEVRWEGVLEQKSGTVVDLSLGGCFILSAHQVKTGELIRLDFGDLLIWGEVRYQIEEMGFGIRFTAVVGDQETRLAQVIADAKTSAANAKEQEVQSK